MLNLSLGDVMFVSIKNYICKNFVCRMCVRWWVYVSETRFCVEYWLPSSVSFLIPVYPSSGGRVYLRYAEISVRLLLVRISNERCLLA